MHCYSDRSTNGVAIATAASRVCISCIHIHRTSFLFVSFICSIFFLFLTTPSTLAQNNAGGNPGSEFNNDAFLKSLSFTPGALDPPFSPDVTSYSLFLQSNQDSVVINTVLDDPVGGSSWRSVDGADKVYQPPGDYRLSVTKTGVTQLVIFNYAKDSTTVIKYQILIYRPAQISSDNANLFAVAWTNGQVTPATFSSKIFSYTLTLPNSANSYTIGTTVSAADSNAYIQVIIDSQNARTISTDVQANLVILPTTKQIKFNVIAQSARVQQQYTYIIQRSGVAQGGYGVEGDPIFTGLQGQVYQIHGVDREYYNLISTPTLQINSQFIYLDEGKCPKIEAHGDCWSHPGSYLGQIGVMLRVPFAPKNRDNQGDENDDEDASVIKTSHDLLGHRLTPRKVRSILADPSSFSSNTSLSSSLYSLTQYLLIQSGPADTGFELVQLNERTLKVGDLVVLPKLTKELEKLHELTEQSGENDGESSTSHQHSFLHYHNTHKLTLYTGSLTFTFTNSDHFINQKLRFSSPAIKKAYASGRAKMHGLLGQSVRNKVWNEYKLKYIESGDVDNYVVAATAMDVENTSTSRKELYQAGTSPYSGGESDEDDNDLFTEEQSLLSSSTSTSAYSLDPSSLLYSKQRLFSNLFVYNEFMLDSELEKIEWEVEDAKIDRKLNKKLFGAAASHGRAKKKLIKD